MAIVYNAMFAAAVVAIASRFVGMRKVRTAQGTVLDNVKAEQSRLSETKPTESATERYRPEPCRKAGEWVRVKWCGKSAPRPG